MRIASVGLLLLGTASAASASAQDTEGLDRYVKGEQDSP